MLHENAAKYLLASIRGGYASAPHAAAAEFTPGVAKKGMSVLIAPRSPQALRGHLCSFVHFLSISGESADRRLYTRKRLRTEALRASRQAVREHCRHARPWTRSFTCGPTPGKHRILGARSRSTICIPTCCGTHAAPESKAHPPNQYAVGQEPVDLPHYNPSLG